MHTKTRMHPGVCIPYDMHLFTVVWCGVDFRTGWVCVFAENSQSSSTRYNWNVLLECLFGSHARHSSPANCAIKCGFHGVLLSVSVGVCTSHMVPLTYFIKLAINWHFHYYIIKGKPFEPNNCIRMNSVTRKFFLIDIVSFLIVVNVILNLEIVDGLIRC